MGDDSTRDPQPEPAATDAPHREQHTHEKPIEEEVGDFITGHVLEKDTVFFEG
jgi:hypothetical protein